VIMQMQTLLQILIPVLIVLGPALGHIIKKINEQTEQRRTQMERQRLRDEMLRTGRTPDESRRQTPVPGRPTPRPAAQGGAAARTNLEEIARRRKAQLEELRRRQQTARAQAPATRPAPVGPAPPTGPVRRPAPQVRPPTPVAQPRPAPRPARPAPAQRTTGRPSAPRPVRRERPTRRLEARPAISDAEPSVHLEMGGLGAIERVTPTKAEVSHPSVRVPRSGTEWRRAIVLAELLSAPVALRDQPF